MGHKVIQIDVKAANMVYKGLQMNRSLCYMVPKIMQGSKDGALKYKNVPIDAKWASTHFSKVTHGQYIAAILAAIPGTWEFENWLVFVLIFDEFPVESTGRVRQIPTQAKTRIL